MMATKNTHTAVLNTPVGKFGICVRNNQLVGTEFLPPETPEQAPTDATSREVVRQLEAYFSDPGAQFELPLAVSGTPHRQRVWQALTEIPRGQPVSYGALARKLGSGARAVGGACRANPLPVIVPCHRVVAAHGLGGFSGSTNDETLSIKSWLLEHEAITHA